MGATGLTGQTGQTDQSSQTGNTGSTGQTTQTALQVKKTKMIQELMLLQGKQVILVLKDIKVPQVTLDPGVKFVLAELLG